MSLFISVTINNQQQPKPIRGAPVQLYNNEDVNAYIFKVWLKPIGEEGRLIHTNVKNVYTFEPMWD